MAQLALLAVGAALGSAAAGGGVAFTIGATAISGAAFGGAMGGLVGGFLDQNFIFPALIGGGGGPRPSRLKDIQATTASEGDPMTACIGSQNRIGGEYIWIGKLRSKAVTSGGKGGSNVEGYKYYLDFAIDSWGEGPIDSIPQIWFNGKVVFASERVEVTNDDGTMSPVSHIGLDSSIGGMTTYHGTETQMPDHTISSQFGAANTPAYRGTAYTVFTDVELTDYGNAPPQVQAEVQQIRPETGLTVASAIEFIMKRAGFSDDEMNLDLSVRHLGTFFGGYSWSGPQDTVTLLEPLLSAFDINTRESEGVFYFVRRGYEQQVAVDPDDLSSRESGTETQAIASLPNRGIRVTDVADWQIPSAVLVRYIEHSYDYLQAEQREFMINHPYTGINQIDLPLVISGQQARSIALTRLIRAYTERMTANVDLPPKYLHVEENDVLNVPYNGQNFAIRVTEVDRGNNWLLNFTGILQGVTAIVARPVDCNVIPGSVAGPYDPTQVIFYLAALDVPGMSTSDATTPGIYVATSVPDGTSFQGGTIFQSADGVEGWSNVAGIQNSGVIGYALTELADGPVAYWDNVNTVQVRLFTGTLENATDQQVLAGANRIYIGSECVGFGVATLTDVNTYTLSHLLRGRMCTEPQTASHQLNELCVLFDPDSINFEPINLSDIGSTKVYEAVPSGGAVGDYPNYPVALQGNSLRQYSPCHIAASGTSGSDITFSWTRRTREPNWPIFSSMPPPLLAAVEAYTIEIYADKVLLRTGTATASTSFTWTAADQTSDGYTGGQMGVKIYQQNDYGQRGYPGQAVFTL